jgi:hypothetical protein
MPLRHLIALIIDAHRGDFRPRMESTRKTSLLHKIEPTARRSGFADISGISHRLAVIRIALISGYRFPIPDWR